MAQGDPGVGPYNLDYGAASRAEYLRAGNMAPILNGGSIGSLNMVYMGKDFERIETLGGGLSGRGPIRPDILAKQAAVWSIDAAKNLFLQNDPRLTQRATETYSAFRGYEVRDMAAVNSWYGSAVDQAAYETALGKGPVTPFEVMDRWVKTGKGPGGQSGSGGGGGGGGGGSATVVNLTNPSDAQLLVDQALNGVLGRDATPKEREAFLTALNGAERRNPMTATPTTRSGGVNAQQAALEFAEARPDAAEYTANTQYTDWLMEKIAADPTQGVASGL